MSFVWFSPRGPLRTREQVAAEVHQVSLARGLDELATVIALMTISTEVGTGDGDARQWWCPWNSRVPATNTFPFDSQSDDNRSSGYFQQQPGPNGEPWWGTPENMMTLSQAANTFLDRLSDNYTQAANNPALAGQFAQQVQGSAFPDRYAGKWDEAWAVLRRALNGQPAPSTPEAPVGNRPDFNEFLLWSSSNQSRNGTKPTLFLLHTQEGGGGNAAAEDLAKYLGNPANQVSYHYTVSQASDGGVTVVDVVDTDYAAWSVGNANNQSINLCFAGSRASWNRDQWMAQSHAIDVAAYLAVQDCKKYGMSTRVVPPPYTNGTPGISDHMYVTNVIKWGSHTDVGPGFPWDYFADRVNFWANGGNTAPPPPVTTPAQPVVVGPADDQLNMKWNCLGGQTLVEAIADIRDHVLGTEDRAKPGVVMQ